MKLDSYHQSNQSRHGAIRNGRCELYCHGIGRVIHGNQISVNNIQLLKSERMFRVIDVSQHIKYYKP